MSWQQYVQAAQGLGFSKVTIISRPTAQGGGYVPVGYSAQTDVATAYKEGDEDINENAELVKDWKDTKATVFRFYGNKFNIVQRDTENGNWIVASKGKEVIVARQFNTIWFIAYAITGGNAVKKGEKTQKANFANAPGAFAKISSQLWDALEEAGF